MRSLLITASLLLFISGTRTQDGFDLSDAFDDATPKPKEPTKSPEKPKPHDGFDLGDALLPGPKTTKKPSVPSGGGGGGGDGFDLGDALLPGPKTTKKPSVPSGGGGGGGGSFNDDDLLNTLDDGYQPDKTGSRGRAADYDSAGGADQPQDPDLLLAQLLKTLSALLPQELLEWVSNVKRALGPLVERGLDLLQNLA